MFTKGELLEHVRRPEWGVGMVADIEQRENGHVYHVLFSEGGRRRVTAEFLRLVEDVGGVEVGVAVEPVASVRRAQVEKVARQTAHYQQARARKKCPQCGERFAGDKWACAPCRKRHGELKRKRGPTPRKSRAEVRPRWSAAELAALEASTSASHEDVAALLGRTPESVRAKRKALATSSTRAGAKPREEHA